MKKTIISIILLMIFVLSMVGSAFATTEYNIEPEIEFQKMNWFKNLFSQGFYISGGSVTQNVKRGDLIESTIDLRFRVAGDRSRLKLYFYNTNKNSYSFIGSKEYAYSSKVGDWIQVSAKNLDTNIMSEQWCGDYIKIAGVHEVRVDGVWKVDPKLTSELNTNYATRESISSNFVLKCDIACDKKNQAPYCMANNIYQQVVNDNCAYESKKIKSCSSNEVCENAKCIPKTVPPCSNYKYVCSGNNILAICETDNSDFNINKNCESLGLVCQNGDCVSNQPEIREKIVWFVDGESCSSLSIPETEDIDGSFNSEQSCLDSIIVNNIDDIDNNNNNNNNEESTFIDEITDWIDTTSKNQPTTFWGIVVLILLSLSGIIYLLIPQGVSKR
jgi:hypothetical protein